MSRGRYDGVAEWYEGFRPALAPDELDAFSAVIRETARVLRPEAPVVYIGAHPCFVGPHSLFVGAEGVPLGAGFRVERFEELGDQDYPHVVALRARR